VEIIFKVSNEPDKPINWKRYAKNCKTQKKAQARQEHLQRWERIRDSEFGVKQLADH
jgi:hypothetical protein